MSDLGNPPWKPRFPTLVTHVKHRYSDVGNLGLQIFTKQTLVVNVQKQSKRASIHILLLQRKHLTYLSKKRFEKLCCTKKIREIK